MDGVGVMHGDGVMCAITAATAAVVVLGLVVDRT